MAGDLGTPAGVPVFSSDWARACAECLNGREGYRVAAGSWEAVIVLTMTDAGAPGEVRRVLLDLAEGICREARAAAVEDEAAARYILSGTAQTWREMLGGALPPLMAIMTGRLRLAKGNLMELIPYVNAAKELVSAAALVPATFP